MSRSFATVMAYGRLAGAAEKTLPDADSPTDEPSPPPGPDVDREAVPALAGAVVRGVRLASIGFAASQVLTFAAYLVLVRLLTPNDFGLYAAGTVITGVGGLFAESGMLAALINRRGEIQEAASTAFFALLMSGVLLTFGSLALSPVVGLILDQPGVTAITAAMSGWLFIRALTIVPDALLQRSFSFARRVVVDPLGSLTFAAVAIPAAALGAGAWALVAGTYASMVMQALSAWGFVRFRPHWREASMSLWREMSGFARSVIMAETLRRVAAQVDALALGRFKGTAPLGQYRSGLRLAEQPASAFIAVTAYVLLPTFARIGHMPERIASAARRAYWVAMTVVIPVSFAAAPLGVPLAVAFLGPRWVPAGHVVSGLCGFVLGTCVISIASEILKAVGRPGVLVRIQIVGFTLIVPTVITTALLWGTLGVAIAMSFSSCLTAAYALLRLSSVLELGLADLASTFAGPVAALAVMIPAMLLYGAQFDPLRQSEATRLLVLAGEVALGFVTYSAALAVIDPARRREAVRLMRRRQSREDQPQPSAP